MFVSYKNKNIQEDHHYTYFKLSENINLVLLCNFGDILNKIYINVCLAYIGHRGCCWPIHQNLFIQTIKLNYILLTFGDFCPLVFDVLLQTLTYTHIYHNQFMHDDELALQI